MKSHFHEYFYPTEIDIKEVWNDSLIVFDTCALLNLYRYSEKTRNDFISLLDSNKNRLWIPYQVAMEFLRNRRTAIKEQEKAYDEINKGLDNAINIAKEVLNKYKKHAVLDTVDIRDKIMNFISDIKNDIQEKRTKHPQYDTNDTLLEKISLFYECNVGDDFEESELARLYKEGERRYKQMLPPGFKDAKNKVSLGERYLYGDLIVWKQIIKKSRDEKRNVIFVTDDQKEDWWQIESGKIISPRLELYKEFLSETNQRILIYKADSFLYHSNEYLKNDSKKIADETIEEVKVVISKPLNLNLFLKTDLQDNNMDDSSRLNLLVTPQDNQFDIYAKQYSYLNDSEKLSIYDRELSSDAFLLNSSDCRIIAQDKGYFSKPNGLKLSRCDDKLLDNSILIDANSTQGLKLDSISKYISTFDNPSDYLKDGK